MTATRKDSKLFPIVVTESISWRTPYTFSRFSTATYSPCESLNIFFFLSMIFKDPFGCHSPTSPLTCVEPSINHDFLCKILPFVVS
ncbi:Os06g0158050 [Oryza sativa Japonica Group]|uniref:Os06g0158050 protein n=1 Tax=Oryza sativa subsp. japonica TaxID=39947 RepID=A0A0P0WST1_ORYSJ|nr:hypothetical protein EE612_032054 [Oryza sativa]BAS96256.1 Os06g0158050 [Oryza sativa Japonica Group]